MHDINKIRINPEEFDKELVKRGENKLASEIITLDNKVREGKTRLQNLQAEKNHIAKEIGFLKSKQQDASKFLSKAEEIKKEITELENNQAEIELNKILAAIPNILAHDVPYGEGEDDNVIIREFGKIPNFTFTPKQHFEFDENLMNFSDASLVSGARFVILKDELAKLERALANFMLDLLTEEYGFTEISVPLLVNDQTMYGTGQLPKFAADAFKTEDGRWLISTAEIALANLAQNKILKQEELPQRFVAYTPCFRKEAGSAGKDTRGMIRLHQFTKVEMVCLTEASKSEEEHENITSIAEDILKKLEIPYRIVLLCSKDTGFSAKKTYDLEVWLPGQNCYREISSCSNCGDFQARRMKARAKNNEGKNVFIHSLNGSALAIGRTIAAILENYQNEDGSVNIPKILQPYMQNKEIILT
jgi:seryl-tRNA synthetase